MFGDQVAPAGVDTVEVGELGIVQAEAVVVHGCQVDVAHAAGDRQVADPFRVELFRGEL